jgi:CheY-like chemotaxis protein
MEKLLVVDDDEALRRLMRLELCDKYEVLDSGEPQHGLALALEHQPDAILLDLRMPKYSGYELLQTYTSFSHTQNIPVIVVSGEAGSQTKEHCKQLGAVGYFEKPIDFDALRTYLEQTVKTRQYVPRAEVRVRLRVPLKLAGSDGSGDKVTVAAVTEDVSMSGFLCACSTQFHASSPLDVYLTTGREEYVGKARIVHSSAKAASVWHYGCQFIEKVGPWVLR